MMGRIDPWCCEIGCPRRAAYRITDMRAETPYDQASTDACQRHAGALGADDSWSIVLPLPTELPETWGWNDAREQYESSANDSVSSFNIVTSEIMFADDGEDGLEVTHAHASVLLATLVRAYGREVVAAWAMTVGTE